MSLSLAAQAWPREAALSIDEYINSWSKGRAVERDDESDRQNWRKCQNVDQLM